MLPIMTKKKKKKKKNVFEKLVALLELVSRTVLGTKKEQRCIAFYVCNIWTLLLGLCHFAFCSRIVIVFTASYIC